ncbi:MAG TPA: 4'-phosphopantetheinyl transferase superfamily protein [Acidothermaceae bacterium]|jgi:holo-[acyl-carrier protein] synthase|nr:4'-phosphopantetheinyl transferase superfamily protein [Acidothermaceae bacterium]
MSWGIGIDLCETGGIAERMGKHPHWRQTVFTGEEQAYCDAQWSPFEHFAGRFAAKEAVVKALQIDGWDPLEVEICDGDPAPQVRLSGAIAEAAARLGVRVTVSITHVTTMAAAVALAVPNPTSRDAE